MFRLFEDLNKTFVIICFAKFIKYIYGSTECLGLNLFLLVGGFSESSVIQDGIKRAFSDKQIIIPPESGIVVLKGAVIYAFLSLSA
jgi:molecular chaperone DnaK (HSP70)